MDFIQIGTLKEHYKIGFPFENWLLVLTIFPTREPDLKMVSILYLTYEIFDGFHSILVL